MKCDFLAIGAHPDDVELGCGGTIIKLIAEGKTVSVIDLTEGELGTRGTAETRAEEAANAAKILGISSRENLKLKDGFLNNSEDYQLKVVEKIRKYKPEIVLANAIDDRHPDHAKAAKLVSDACFLSGLKKIETFDNDQPQEVWRPKHIFHYIQWKNVVPDTFDMLCTMQLSMSATGIQHLQLILLKNEQKASITMLPYHML